MTFDDIKQKLRDSKLIEVQDRFGKYYQSKLFVAYNDKEGWAFHLTRCGEKDVFAATRVVPYFEAIIGFENVPAHVLEMELDWAENVCAKYGDVTAAMKVYKKE